MASSMYVTWPQAIYVLSLPVLASGVGTAAGYFMVRSSPDHVESRADSDTNAELKARFAELKADLQEIKQMLRRG